MAAIGMPVDTVEDNPILKAAKGTVSDFITYTNEISKKQQNQIVEANEVTGKIAEAIQSGTSAKQVIAKQQDVATLQAQNATIDAFNKAGGAEFLSSLMAELQSTTKEVLDAQNKVEAIQDKPVDGALDYIAKQFELLVPEERLAAAQTRAANVTQSIANITGAQESIQRAIATTKQTINTATIEAAQQGILAQGQEALAKTQLESIARNSQQLDAVMRAKHAQLDAHMQEYQLYNTEENQTQRRAEHALQIKGLELQLQKYKDSREKAAIDLEAAKLALEETKDPNRKAALQASYSTKVREFEDTEKFRKIATNSVQKVQAMLGLPIEDTVNIMWGLTQPGDTGKKYRRMLELGTSPNPVLGNTPAEASQNITIAAPEGASLSPPIKALAIVQATQTAKYKKDPAGAPKDEETQISDFNTTARELFGAMAENIKFGDSSNFYQAPPMPVIANMEAVKSSKVYKTVLEPLQMKEFSTKAIFNAVSAGIQANTISVEEATTGIEALYKSIAAYNNSYWNFKRVGLPEQTSYKTTVHSVNDYAPGLSFPTTWSSYEEPVVDLLDPVQIKKAILESLAATRNFGGFK